MIEPIVQEEQAISAFQAALISLSEEMPSEGPLAKMQAKAWEQLVSCGLPTRKTDEFRYVPLRKLYEHGYQQTSATTIDPKQFDDAIYPECKESVLVFVNGHYSPQLSCTTAIPKRVAISSLEEGTKTYGAFLTNHWAKMVKEETDAFAFLNAALHRDGLFIYLPPKTVVENPVQILHLIDAQDDRALLLPRMQCFVGAHSQVEFVASQVVISGSAYCLSTVIDVVIEEESHVRFSQSQCDGPGAIWNFDAIRSILKKNSTFNVVTVTDGSTSIRNDYRSILAGENAEVALNGVWMLSGNKEAHTHVLIDHQAPLCRSRQLFKGALNDFSHSSFEGKILVRQAAQKTDAFQLNNNLLLSERAQADSKPNLEIFADDVKASHGATFGQLDAEQMFMMRSRGIPQSEAKNLLVGGFCKEVIDLVTVSSLWNELNDRLKRYREG